ncbi:hypothetical protein ACIPSE_34085 [Streptomyces sp. NPDC090106]|uniref:hypothetical protein n=1 Tax=Streptomyces sp. NPDC090106 TaxID=3365946 RepID=UPI0037F7596A
MSAYGPAVFVARKDGADLSDEEQASVMRLVRDACRGLNMTGADGDPVAPSDRGYDEEEQRALGILLHSSYGYHADLPEEVRVDQEKAWEREGARVAGWVEREAPGTYVFTAYGVED